MTHALAPHPSLPSPSRPLLIAALCAGALLVSACDKMPGVPSPNAPPAPKAEAVATPVSAPAAPVYVPPGAEQLYQMVAPIALYPDKLVAQVLAGSTYPEQVTAADQWLAQNAALKAGPLADAAELQPWDPSVKSLTAFKPVLHQMASNLPWTTSLGQAYYHDPDDVMNAIQVMRERASKAGKLKSTKQLRVATGSAPVAGYAPDPNAPSYYSGPIIVEPPAQYITIEPAQPDVVYVPAYDPRDIYGEPVAVYPGYAYAAPVYAEPRYSNAQIATAGALTFGTAVIVGAALQRHGWGWNSWDMNWGRPDTYRGGNRPPQAARGFDRPAVVYNRSTYTSRTQEPTINPTRRNNFVDNAGRPQMPTPTPSPQFDPARRQQAQQAQQQLQQAQPTQRVQQEQLLRQQAQPQSPQQALAGRQGPQAQIQQQQQQQEQARRLQMQPGQGPQPPQARTPQQQLRQQLQPQEARQAQPGQPEAQALQRDPQSRLRQQAEQQARRQQAQAPQAPGPAPAPAAAERQARPQPQQAQQAQAQQTLARRQQEQAGQQQQQQQAQQAQQQARQAQMQQQMQQRQQQVQAQQAQAQQQQAQQVQARQQQQQLAQQNQARQQQAQAQLQQRQQQAQQQQQQHAREPAQGQPPGQRLPGRRPQDEVNR